MIKNNFKKLIYILNLLNMFLVELYIYSAKNGGISISNFDNIQNKKTFLYIEDKKINNLNNRKPINISLSLDNSHIYPSLIVMTSALENNDKDKNILIFYLLLSYDFDDNNLEIFESLKLKYDVRINYYYMINFFNNLIKWRGSNAIYYKLFIPILFPYIERMIHLDGDTIVLKDLWEMFNLPFDGNYFLAQRTVIGAFKDKGLKKNPINVGVMLINIKKIREVNMDFEIIYYLFTKKTTEQMSVNLICLDKIGYLPFRFGIFFIGDIKTFVKQVGDKMMERVNLTEVKEAMEDPSIVHILFCTPKYWENKTKANSGKNDWCKNYQNLFYFYAHKTNYYRKIYNKYMEK